LSGLTAGGLRATPLPGMRFNLVRFPVVSLVPSSTTGFRPSSLRDEEAGRPDGETSGVPDSDASFEALLDEKVCRCADVHAVELRPERCVEIGSVESEQDAGAGG